MIRIASILTFTVSLFISANMLRAQDLEEMMKQGAALEKAFRDEDALRKYEEVVAADAANVEAICRISELYNMIGKRQPSKEKQRQYYDKGREYALRALKLNPNNSEANFVMAISLGRIAQISSGEEKIRAVKDIRTYADKCIRLDPANYKGYHVLGKWHFEVSDLTALERWLVKVAYGELPPASLDDAIDNYEKSRQLFPDFLLNYLELAKAYKRKGDVSKARVLLTQMLKMPALGTDDPKIKGLGKKMLGEL